MTYGTGCEYWSTTNISRAYVPGASGGTRPTAWKWSVGLHWMTVVPVPCGLWSSASTAVPGGPKFEPWIVIGKLLYAGPGAGSVAPTYGGWYAYSKAGPGCPVPTRTVSGRLPPEPGAVSAWISESLTRAMTVQSSPLMSTMGAASSPSTPKFEPVIVTSRPPCVGTGLGETSLTIGASTENADVPVARPFTSTQPSTCVPGGRFGRVNCSSSWLMRWHSAIFPPMRTTFSVAAVPKFAPWIVIRTPPRAGPSSGENLVSCGGS